MEPGANGKEAKPSASPWTVQIAKVYGIPIRIHFTLVLFLAWIGIAGGRQGALSWPLVAVAILACVILHELGHALVGLHFGVRTRDITLYPIGGVAMLESRPKPREELWIALAGPMVNLLIAILLACEIAATYTPDRFLAAVEANQSFIGIVFVANLWLALFNLIPAFPMDGGRVLRAGLALGLGETKATQIASTVGQALAIGIGLLGLFEGEIVLMLIAFFIFVGAGQEAYTSRTLGLIEGFTVRDAMQTRYRTIAHGETLDTAAKMLLEGSQHDFPVLAGDEVLGLLSRNDIARGLSTVGPSGYVSEAMTREPLFMDPGVTLESAIEAIGKSPSKLILVMEEGSLTGLLTNENLSEFIMLEAARKRPRR